MKDWEKKIDWAKVHLLQKQPFFGCLLFNLQPKPDDRCPTMWTDGRRIGFNPEFVETLTREEVAGVLCHEIWHVVCKHMLRRGPRQPFKWNIACDHVVNNAVTKSGLRLPSCAVPGIDGKNAEQVYDEMKDPPGGEGGPISIGEVFDAMAEGAPGGEGEEGKSGSGGGRPLTEAEKDELSSKVDVMVRAAANAAKQAGKLPADMERELDHLLEPLVPWRDVLARFVTEKAKNDFSWTRPNRRYRPLGLTLPSADGYTISKGAVACDTSGSMDLEQLRRVCSEAIGLMSAYEEEGDMEDPGLDIYWFDHACHHQRVMDAREVKPVGGGGTSFRIVFEKLKELNHQPKWLVLLTDGYCDDYGPDPGFPVLWILTQQHPQGFKPAFGEIAHLIA